MHVRYQIDSNYDYFDLINLANFLAPDGMFSLLLSGSCYDSAESSFLCLFPFESIVITARKDEDPWEAIKKKLVFEKQGSDLPEWIGYFAYEMGAYADSTAQIPHFDNEYPDAFFQRYGLILKLNHQTKNLIVQCHLDCPESRLQQFIDKSFWSLKKQIPNLPSSKFEIKIEKALEDFDSYAKKIDEAKKHIIEGNIYQINISHECVYTGAFDPLSLFKKNFERNPAPFSLYLKLNENHTIISTSPERLLRFRDGFLETRPIKGTIQRGANEDEDEVNKAFLLASEKERSELLMITDLMRNDLSRVSIPGSVVVEKIWNCEKYANVFHLLSIIRSKALSEMHPLNILRAVFPGGSITGCPKIRAMEIIHNIEKLPRGIYTGSIGYFSENGDFDFNIAIRTLDIYKNKIRLRLGGGIVYDSEACLEYQETLDKGKTLFESFLT